MNSTMQQYFNSKPYPFQQQVIPSILMMMKQRIQPQPILLVQSTGGGKSAVPQTCGLTVPGVTIVQCLVPHNKINYWSKCSELVLHWWSSSICWVWYHISFRVLWYGNYVNWSHAHQCITRTKFVDSYQSSTTLYVSHHEQQSIHWRDIFIWVLYNRLKRRQPLEPFSQHYYSTTTTIIAKQLSAKMLQVH